MENLCSHDRHLTNKMVAMNRMRMEDEKNAKKNKKIDQSIDLTQFFKSSFPKQPGMSNLKFQRYIIKQ